MIYLTVIAGLEALVIAGLVVALMLHSKGCAELIGHLETQHAAERARFLAAVQRPDLVQPPQPLRQRTPEQAARERERARQFAQVGTVQHARPE